MSDDPGRLEEEDGSPTDGAVKRVGRARICKQCRFTTTNVREFSNHRLHAHAEENPEEKALNRRTASKRRSSSVVNNNTEDQKNKIPVVTEADPKIKETSKENILEDCQKTTEKEATTTLEKTDTDNQIVNIENTNKSDAVDKNPNNSDTVDQKTKSTEESIENSGEMSEKFTTEPDFNLSETKPVKTMEGERRISDELLNSLALAPKIRTESPMDWKKSEIDRTHAGMRKPSAEKILIEKQNGVTEEVLLIKRDEDQDDEPRLVIADDAENDPMDHGGLGPHSHYRSGNIQNRTYLCNACDYSTTNAKSYLHHKKDAHNPEMIIYECDICDYATKYKQKLPRHRKLHFSANGFTESDLDSSLTERELREMKEISSFNADFVNGEEEMDEEGDMEEDDEEEIAAVLTGASPNIMAQTREGVPVEKKKRIRQEVDPLKYFEVMDESGVKYACSKCGNVYKWRKSLNKHWKEKHFGETPDLTKPPATLQNYTLYSRYKPKVGGQPPPPAAPNVVYAAAIPSPTNQQKSRITPTMKADNEVRDLSNMMMPRQIGPFISSTSPDLFQSQLLSLASQAARMPENHHEMRKMIDELQRRSNALKNRKVTNNERTSTSPFQENSQREPIDYSKPLDFSKKTDVKSEPSWGDNNSESADSLQEMPISLSQANSQIALAMKQGSPSEGDVDNNSLQCNKCSFVAKTLVEYSAHMSLHPNKRAFKCAECQSQFNSVEELNKHFLDNHSEKIQEHKEAIQKIPHGLQQTYHILKMPLDHISNLSSQELLSNEPKMLKCSMCQFVAKWPAELQKHAVSHSEERPFVCMVCASTYKWKWDLVKHFEKSHNSLPNPYKRREGGGVAASPSTPPLESISRAASALMDAGLPTGNYIMDEESPPTKKRRLSETKIQDAEDFYRELLERQIKHRREMGLNSDLLQIPNRPNSAPSHKNGESMKDDYLNSDSTDSFTPKYQIAEALKHRIQSGKHHEEESSTPKSGKNGSEVPLPYKCSVCEYRARWPSEISQHMKNHSNEKPFHCPRCSYKSKWKWDVVKHLRRCGGGTVHDVIDTSKIKKMAPPNVMVLPHGNMHQQQIPQSQKISPGQSLYPSHQRPKSLSPAINNLALLTSPNFSLAVGGQDHKGLVNLMSQNGHQGKNINGSQNVTSIEKDGLFHCMECPFVGNSHAELKRHAVLHSENKPFSCSMCGYSSRWKCDLKKHMKVYNHFNTINQSENNDDMEILNEKINDIDDESDEEKSTLYMCPQCPYNSYKKSAFEHHLRIHGNFISSDDDLEPTIPAKQSDSKFKCTKCDYQGNDLSSFLQHKRSHGNQPSSAVESRDSVSPLQSESRSLSPVPSEVSNRTLHLKHRRKPVKQFRCNKCPYICFKRSALINHENLHQSQGNDAYLCMFCDYNVFSKNLLLQHMRLHPEYNPAEGSEHDTRVSAAELMEMEELEEKELASDERNDSSLPEENNNIDEYESGFDLMTGQISPNKRAETPQNMPSTPERSPQNNNLKGTTNNNTSSGGGLPCEWCSATFPNVVTLYQHAQANHPSQLKAQEAGDIAAQQAPSKTSQLEQIVRGRQREYQVFHQTAIQHPQLSQQFGLTLSQLQNQSGKQKLVPLAPKSQIGDQSMTPDQSNSLEELLLAKQQIAALNARKSASQQRRSRSFQCTKCSFTAPNAVTYLRHIERHGSNCKHTCLYCDYSIDRLNLLYQHMKGTHGTKWAGTTEEKIHLTIGEDSNNNIIDALNMSEQNFQTDDLNNSFNSSTNDSFEGYWEITHRENLIAQQHQESGEQDRMETDASEFEDQSENAVMMPLPQKGPKPLLKLKGNTIFKGVMIQVCSLDGRKHYKCPRCVYVNNNAANTANHVKQHGQNKKYTCKNCDYSVDNYKHIQHHMDTVHPKELEFVIVNSSPSTLLIDDFPEEIGKSQGHVDTPFTCSKCPYRGADQQKFQIHLSRHGSNGKYECQLCDYSVDKYSILHHHAKLHSNKFLSVKDIEAEEDDDMIDSNQVNKSRQSINKNNLRDPERIRFKCSCCPFYTFAKVDILKHRLNHINKSSLSCQLCTYSSNDNTELRQHLKFHQTPPSGNQLQDITLDPYNDSYKLIEQIPDGSEDAEVGEAGEFGEDQTFGETGDNMEDIEDEVEVAMMEEELRETMSYGQIGDNTNLNAEGTFDNELQFRTFKCTICPFSSNSNAEFKKHSRLHGSTLKFKCDYCSYSLDRVNLISQHRKLHFRESEFEPTPLMKNLLNKDHEDYEIMLEKVGDDIAYPPTESGLKNVEESAELNSFCQKMEQDDKISCTKEDELLLHAQVHFPSTKLDWDMMKHLRKQTQSYRKNLSKMFPNNEGNKEKNSKMIDEMDEPDSTVHDTSKTDGTAEGESENKNKDGVKENEKTKVYLCQFCEREFDCKTTMLQHEKQHLVGT